MYSTITVQYALGEGVGSGWTAAGRDLDLRSSAKKKRRYLPQEKHPQGTPCLDVDAHINKNTNTMSKPSRESRLLASLHVLAMETLGLWWPLWSLDNLSRTLGSAVVLHLISVAVL